ncbi:hypothetical protein NC651_038889 [Populus alba x Populus x berolinensis]|nr:hypothetical protein NC651_038889 [Populus alba x Populus x berolinensis]
MAPPKVYLFDEIAKHKKTEDCWPNISGEVAFFPSSICTTNKCAGKGKRKQLAED